MRKGKKQKLIVCLLHLHREKIEIGWKKKVWEDGIKETSKLSLSRKNFMQIFIWQFDAQHLFDFHFIFSYGYVL